MQSQPAPADFTSAYSSALWLAGRFGRVFPIDHPDLVACAGLHGPKTPCDGTRGKHPCVAWGSKSTADPDQLARHFMRMRRNIGLPCGPAKLLVVDEDEPGAFAAYAGSIGEAVPDTFRVSTSRGEHFYFRQDGDLTNSDGALRDLKIDVRGKGGMVVAPGSKHASGHLYLPVDPDADVAEIPAWLERTVRQRTGKSKPSATAAGGSFAEPDPLAAPHSDPIPDGKRHNALVSYAGSLRRRDVWLDEAKVLMRRRLLDCVQPPEARWEVTDEEAIAKLEDVYERYAPDEVPAAIGGPDDEERQSLYERAVAREAQVLRVREDAGRLVRQERAGALESPSFVRLGEFLTVEDEPEAFRVDRLWPVGGRIICAAQYKAGKTTLRDNLVRALADVVPFLDTFPVNRPTGRVAVIDNELDERMVRRWLRDQGISNVDRITVLSLRGKVGTFDLLDDATRAGWAAKLKAEDVSVVLFDCLRPVLDALGLSEDKDSGRFLVAFDALLAEAGAAEGFVVHHMGHSGERSRGDTRLRDWPDVEWKLLRDKDETGQQHDDEQRRIYFSAFGRDVDVPEGLLSFDPSARRLTLAGGSRKQAAADAVIPDVLAYLADNAGASQRAVETALGPTHKRADVRSALRRCMERGQVRTENGSRRAVLHFLTTPECASAPSAPAVRQRSPDECASAPIGGALHSHTSETEDPGALNVAGEHLAVAS